MSSFDNYELQEPLHNNLQTLIYRARRKSDSHSVIIKTSSTETPEKEILDRLEREYSLLQNLQMVGISHPLDYIKNSGQHAIILDDQGGSVLSDFLQSRPLPAEEFLPLAIQLCDIISGLHQKNIIHKDIKPDNILINQRSGKITLIDFSIFSELNEEYQILIDPNRLEGTLAYLSPEQTGRMGCTIDYRSDLYSLGVTFYELLTGKLPFSAKDAIGYCYAHLTKKPLAPNKVNDQIPNILAKIILKLLEKRKEDRYQSALGLKQDLLICWDCLQKNLPLHDFILGKNDVPTQFHVSQKLYGRAAEQKIILDLVEQATQGQTVLLTIGGYSGVGKTVLVNETHKPITAKHGYFCSGKFDQLQRSHPYHAWQQALSHLVRQILTENDSSLAQWKQKLLDTLGVNISLMIDFIPELEYIVGKQPPVQKLGLDASQNRFEMTFFNLIKIFAHAFGPLIIFLDDLQWADLSSINLLEQLTRRYTVGHLMIIGSYRDNEVDNGHPLASSIEKISVSPTTTYQHIKLAPLRKEIVNQLIADTLYTHPDNTNPLTEVCFNKTEGNPFFLNEFLKYCHNTKQIYFDNLSGAWQWDISGINNLEVSNEVVDLMIAKIKALSVGSQNVLKIAAALGNQFDINVLCAMADKDRQKVTEQLLPAVQNGFVIPLDENFKKYNLLTSNNYHFKFAHDRIQQAAYQLIPQQQVAPMHLKIARFIYSYSLPNNVEENIFQITNQYNKSIELLKDESEKRELANLNCLAARSAKIAAAYKSAYEHLRTALQLLPEKRWDNDYYQLTYDITVAYSEACALQNKYADMDQMVDEVLTHAKTLLEKIAAYEIRMSSLFHQEKYLDAINLGLNTLKMLGVKIPKKTRKYHLLLGFIRLQGLLRGKKIADFIHLPAMTDPNQLAITRILNRLTEHMFAADHAYGPLAIIEMIMRSLKYGNSNLSATSYISASFLYWIVNDLTRAEEFGDLACKLQNINPDQSKTAFVLDMHAAHEIPWSKNFDVVPEICLKAYHLGLDYGDFTYASYSLMAHLYFKFYCAVPLKKVKEEIDKYLPALTSLQNSVATHVINNFQQTIYNLTHQLPNPDYFDGEYCNETDLIPQLITKNEWITLSSLYGLKMMLAFMFQRYSAVITYAKQAKRERMVGLVGFANLIFYEALAYIKQYPTASLTQRLHYRATLAKALRYYKKWAHHAKENWAHRYHFLLAEYYQIKHDTNSAIQHYEIAIKEAKRYNRIIDLALICECTGEFYLGLKAEQSAIKYLNDARYYYSLWQAEAKVLNLEVRFAEYLHTRDEIAATEIGRTISLDTTLTKLDHLDLETVLKTTQTISKEIKLAPLVNRVLHLMMENVGAENGCLMLMKENQLFVEGYRNSDNKISYLLASKPINEFNNVPHKIIDYVRRTQQFLLISDLRNNEEYGSDTYFQQKNIKSVMCCPIVKQATFIGIVYFENSHVYNAFTTHHLDLIEIMAAQTAISIENARLYQSFERFVPKEFIHLLGKQNLTEVNAGDYQELNLTMLFMDIRSFTTLSEKHSASEVFQFLNDYLHHMEPIITKHHGFIDKYIGDAIMALFPEDATFAVQAAIDLQRQLQIFNRKNSQPGFGEVRAGIGINTGPVMLGTIGSKKRLDGTVISDTVNLASRIESLNKRYGTGLLISQNALQTFQHNKEFMLRLVDIVRVKGKTEPERIYEILDIDPHRALKINTLDIYNRAFALYQAEKFADAKLEFEKCLAVCPQDTVALVLKDRCQLFLERGKPKDWDGAIVYDF